MRDVGGKKVRVEREGRWRMRRGMGGYPELLVKPATEKRSGDLRLGLADCDDVELPAWLRHQPRGD